MKSHLLAAGLLFAGTLSPALAGGLVPASDHFIEARADAAANSVASGMHVPIVTSSVAETRSYGMAGTGEYAGETYAREPASRALERRPGGPAARVAVSRPWVGVGNATDPG